MLSGASLHSEAQQSNFCLIVAPTRLGHAVNSGWIKGCGGVSVNGDAAETSTQPMTPTQEAHGSARLASPEESFILLQQKTHLNHEVLCTLMAEATAIMNTRPLLPVSFILSPSVLLTQKAGVPPHPGDSSDKDLNTKSGDRHKLLQTPNLYRELIGAKST